MRSLVDYGSGAGTAMYYLQEPGFPQNLGDGLYSGDFNTGVAFHPRKRYEATYQVQQKPIRDSSMPIGIDVDGFSRMYIASRSGGGFGFSAKPFGNVVMIRPAASDAAAEFPDLNGASDAELLEHLRSTSQVTRINTMREVVTRGRKPTYSQGLLALARDTAAPLYSRAAAVMTLKQLDGDQSHAALTSLYENADVARVRGPAHWAMLPAKSTTRVSKSYLQRCRDKDPRVQMRAIIGLTRSGDVTVADAILPLARDEKLIVADEAVESNDPDADAWSEPHRAIPHAALRAVVSLNAVELLLNKINDAELRETALRGLQEIHSPETVAGLAEKIETTRDKPLARLIAAALFRLYHREGRLGRQDLVEQPPGLQRPVLPCRGLGTDTGSESRPPGRIPEGRSGPTTRNSSG